MKIDDFILKYCISSNIKLTEVTDEKQAYGKYIWQGKAKKFIDGAGYHDVYKNHEVVRIEAGPGMIEITITKG